MACIEDVGGWHNSGEAAVRTAAASWVPELCGNKMVVISATLPAIEGSVTDKIFVVVM